jgi:hypothetical protein
VHHTEIISIDGDSYQWPPEQAVAVVELLDNLREQIVRHYTPQIQAYYRDNLVLDGRPQGADPEFLTVKNLRRNIMRQGAKRVQNLNLRAFVPL